MAPLAKMVYGGTRVCWSRDFGAWWRTKSKRKLDQTEKITKIRGGWGYRSWIQEKLKAKELQIPLILPILHQEKEAMSLRAKHRQGQIFWVRVKFTKSSKYNLIDKYGSSGMITNSRITRLHSMVEF